MPKSSFYQDKLLTNEKANTLLASRSACVVQETVDFLTSLSKEERQKMEQHGFSFANLFSDIACSSLNEHHLQYILGKICQQWPTWHTDVSFEKYHPLHSALRHGNFLLFDTMITYGVDPTCFSYPLHPTEPFHLLDSAVRCRLTSDIQEKAADKAIFSCPFDAKQKQDALVNALHQGNLGAVKSLMKHNARFLTQSLATEMLTLSCSIKPSDTVFELVQQLLKDDRVLKSAQENLPSRRSTPLHQAAYEGNTLVLELLLEHGANINAPDLAYEDRPPALMFASINHQKETMLWLLKHGANPHLLDKNGNNALHWLANSGDYNEEEEKTHVLPCAEILLQQGVSIEQQNCDGDTPIDVAKQYGLRQMEAMLLSKVIRENVKENIESKREMEGNGKGLGKWKM